MKFTNKFSLLIIGYVIIVFVAWGCHGKTRQKAFSDDGVLLKSEQGYPQAIFHEGKYYVTFQGIGGESVDIYCTDDLADMSKAEVRTIWSSQRDSMTHLWSPEIYFIQEKWYVYFEGDDGNTDNHHLFVMECQDADPMTGQFVMKGAIETHAEWNYGIHPNLLQLPDGDLYLLWSGWPTRRSETETQCIYIARMENPWTVSSERVMISKPEYEWERQWINPDGNRSAYPIYVNENPESFVSPDGRKVIVLYSASGIWTVYTTMGMLSAPVSANLLDPSVWRKHEEPVMPADTVNFTSISNVYFVPSADGQQTLMLYEKKRREQGNILRDTYLRPVNWNDNGEPVLN